MNLVNYVYLIFPSHRGVPYELSQVSDIVDAAIGGGVDLDDVRTDAAFYVSAGGTFITRFGPLAIGTVQRFRQYSGGGGLAGAPRAGEKVAW